MSLRVTHTRVWAMHNAIPGPSSAPLAPYPPYLTSSLPPPRPLSPYLSLPLWPLPLHTRLVCPAVVHRPTSPLSACACLRVCCAARYGFHLCGRVTAGLTPGCVGVTRREGPPVSKPPLSLPLPRVVPPLRRPTPPYPPLCTPPHAPLSGHRLGLETRGIIVVESSPALMVLQVRQTVLGRVVTVASRRQGLRPGPSCMPTPVGGV